MSERRCPICSEPVGGTDEPDFPFCSRRCKLVDLGNWLGEHYRFEGEPVPEQSDARDEHGGGWS